MLSTEDSDTYIVSYFHILTEQTVYQLKWLSNILCAGSAKKF